MVVTHQQNAAPILIVNADDFGHSTGVNQGVQQAHREGILTSATLLANGPAFDEAVAIAKDNPDLGVGVHLNLVRGKPLSPPEEIPLLASPGDGFKPFRVRRLTLDFLAQAEKEYRRQIEKIRDAGIVPTHIDFEKHHAWQGPLYLLACRVAEEHGIPAARTLKEPVAWTGRTLGWPGLTRILHAVLLRSGFDLGGGGKNCRLARPDRFLGQTHIGDMTEKVWLQMIPSIPPGTTEVMTHPGLDAPTEQSEMGASWIENKRKTELDALLSPRVREAIAKRGLHLAHYGALAPNKP